MTPEYDIRFDETPLGAAVRDRVLRLTFVDEAGFRTDEMSFDLDNRDYKLAVPKKGAVLSASLGYQGALVLMGRYVVDEVSSTGGQSLRLSIKAKAADMQAGLKVMKTRMWTDETVASIVETIASEHGFEPRISSVYFDMPVGFIPYPQLDQTGESDMNFLTRLSQRYGATWKAVNGFLIFLQAGDNQTATGEVLPVLSVDEADVTSWSAIAPDRGRYQSASASYIDAQTRERMTVDTGGGAPVFALPSLHADANAALAAAQAKLEALQRGNAQLSLTLPGNANLQAERRFEFTTQDSLAAGLWTVRRATHVYAGGGFTTMIEAEVPKGQIQGETG